MGGQKSKNVEQPAGKIFNSRFVFITFMYILTNIGFGVFATTITPYAVSLGFSLTLAGLITSTFSVAALVIRPFAGTVFDQLDRKKLLFFSTFFFGAVIFGYSFVRSVWALILLRVVHGIVFGINTTVMMALASTYLPHNRIGEGMGYFSASMLLGQAIGPTLSAALLGRMGYVGLYGLIAAVICVPSLLIWLLPTEKETGKKEPFHVDVRNLVEPHFLLHALVCAGFSLIAGMSNALVVLIGEARGIEGISIFFTVSSFALMAVRAGIGRISDKVALKHLVDIATIFTCICAALIGRGQTFAVFMAAAVFRAVGQGIGHVSVQSDALKQADRTKVGIVTGTLLIGNDIGNILAPLIGSAVAEKAGYTASFDVCFAIVLILGVIFHIHLVRGGKGRITNDQ